MLHSGIQVKVPQYNTIIAESLSNDGQLFSEKIIGSNQTWRPKWAINVKYPKKYVTYNIKSSIFFSYNISDYSLPTHHW